MKLFRILFLLTCIASTLFSCSDDDINTNCGNANTDFKSLFQSLINSGHTDEVLIDTEIHEYTFKLSANMEICEIGYQSQPDISSTPYIIEIIDSSTNTMIYSASHIFSSNQTSYVTPTTSVNLQSGVTYSIRRIQTNYSSFSDIIGRIARKSLMNFPYTNGIMTITSANFYQNGGPLPNWAVPHIDLILK